jgi:predicted transcriptional regulator
MSHLDRPYFITMGTYQMAILLMFNEHQQLTLNEIEETTKLNTKELEKQIGNLIENKILLSDSVS